MATIMAAAGTAARQGLQGCRLADWVAGRQGAALPHCAPRRRLAASAGAALLHVDDVTAVPTSVRGVPPIASAASPPPVDADTPLVWLHGLLGSGVNFRSIAGHPALTDGGARRSLTVDLRNHGRSPAASAGLTLESMADDVLHTLDARGVRRVTLIGHSLGGRVAALLALRAPHRVARLVIMDVSLSTYAASPAWDSVAAVLAAAAALDPARYTARRDIDTALAATLPNAGERSFLQQNLVATGNGSYTWRMPMAPLLRAMPAFAGFPSPPPTGPYAPVPRLPVTFIAGTRSAFFTPADQPAAAAFFPAATFHPLPGAGHWLHADKPTEFVTLLANVLHDRAN